MNCGLSIAVFSTRLRRDRYVRAVDSDKHRRVRDSLMKSGYGLEMRIAAACRKHWLPTIQSVPYVDPVQEETVREADVVVRIGGQLPFARLMPWSRLAVRPLSQKAVVAGP